jgi:hypothetical protein
LRARTADGGSVVIKRYADPEGAGAAFVAEASGLAFAGSGPRLLAADPGFLMVVLEDLGSHPSLADRLLGCSATVPSRPTARCGSGPRATGGWRP